MKKLILALLSLLLAPHLYACSGTPTTLDNTGATDITTSLQLAIDAASPLTGGSGAVVLAPGRYRKDGPIHIGTGVTVCGANEGPLEPWDIAHVVRGAIIQVTATSANFASPAITMDGPSATLTDVSVWYPDQNHSTASAPVVYPVAIKMTQPSKVARIVIVNAYDGIDIETGRVFIHDSYVGAFHNGIYVDHAQDLVEINTVGLGVWWDVAEALSPPTAIDAWVLNNSNGIVIGRADSIHGNDVFAYYKRVGFYFIDSPDTTQSPRCGYGSFSNVDLDWVQYGIVTVASNSPGWKFTNLDVGAAGALGQSVAYNISGSIQARLVITSGSIRGAWHTATWFNFPANTLFVTQVLQ